MLLMVPMFYVALLTSLSVPDRASRNPSRSNRPGDKATGRKRMNGRAAGNCADNTGQRTRDLNGHTGEQCQGVGMLACRGDAD